MKSSNESVRAAYEAAIISLGYQTYPNGSTVDLYPHVLIGEQSEIQNGDQGSFGQIVTINIEIRNAWAKMGNRITNDTIVNDILQKIITKPHTLIVAGFDMPVLTLDNQMSATEKTATLTINKTILRFKMQLFEN